MIINYDRSRVTVSDKELMRHGYAEGDYHSIRLSFEYTEQQKQENRMRNSGFGNFCIKNKLPYKLMWQKSEYFEQKNTCQIECFTENRKQG